MFENFKVYKTTFAGKPITFETGKFACLTNGAVVVRYGDTTVMVNVTASTKPRDGIDFFPLSVDFEEKLYAVGKIPGSFMKREGRPSDTSILASRVIDRQIRPLFPSDMRNDCSVVATVLSVDKDFSPEVAAMVGASFALAISDIPFNGPIAGCEVGLVEGKLIVNPNAQEREQSTLQLTVAGGTSKICMIEAGADQVADEVMVEAIALAQQEIIKMATFIGEIAKEIGKPKFTFQSKSVDPKLFADVQAFAVEKIRFALDTDDKNIREERLTPIVDEIHAKFDEQYADSISEIDECIYKLQKYVVRRWLLDDGKRVDGRGLNDIRGLASEVNLIPRVHGSGLFTRGQTQVLTIATLGTVGESQIIDGIGDDIPKRYMHHYNFPSYSVGETRPSRGPGRREIGHGALAEKALVPVLPSVEEFPYAMRLVSEILSSNGSTSQGAICASTLSLMDAGVPIKAPVAGISCGLITEGERWMTMVDIQGLEDFFGDMDFKVGGTHTGITAIQVDIKTDGLTMEMIKEAFEKTKKARLYILDEIMLKAIAQPNKELSEYAPKMLTLKIHPDKIREVIGSGGKVIQKITAECNVKIDIQDDGTIFISGTDAASTNRAFEIVKSIGIDPEIGAIYKGKVMRLMAFGAFVEITPGKEGLVHISKLDDARVEKVEDIVKVGDEIFVKIMEIDGQGRINLSRKDAMADMNKN